MIRSEHFKIASLDQNMETAEARHVFVIEEEDPTPSVRGKFVILAILGLIVIVTLMIIVKLL